MSLIEIIRGGQAHHWMITAGYHTPNGPLHLGHLAGPFLGADSLARHLGSHGHNVRCVSAVDSYEAYVLLAARKEGREPIGLARHYYRDAVRTLAGFDIRQDVLLDLHDLPWCDELHRRTHELAEHLEKVGRVRYEVEKVARSRRSGQFLLGPFSLGHCPSCGAGAGGSSCETCGLWFGPTDLRDIRPRMDEDSDVEWAPVTTAFLKAAPQLGGAEASRRYPSPYHELFDRFCAFNGQEVRLTHPLGWGVPYRLGEVEPTVVHNSYGAVWYAAMSLVSDAYTGLTGIGKPFGRDSSVRTVATVGLDGVLAFGLQLAFCDDDLDWQPFTYYNVNHFLQLNGSKLSTSRGHVIWGRDYVDGGLPVDPLRMYLARIAPARRETDFRPDEFGRYVAGTLQDRLCRLVRDTLVRIGEKLPPPLEPPTAQRITDVLLEQSTAFRPPDTDLSIAQRSVETWLVMGESGLAQDHPYWWLKTMTVLVWPFMPSWSARLWQCLGCGGDPSLDGFERATLSNLVGYHPVPDVRAGQVAALLPDAEM